MSECWWKIPLLRSLSPMRRGFVEAVAVALSASLLLWPALNALGLAPSGGDAHGDIAQIGATLLVAYAVEVCWWLKSSPRRSATRENWVGITTGVGCCGLVGIGIAIGLSGDASQAPTALEELAFTGSVVSIGMLGLLVALLPQAMYEWNHSLRAEYTDE